MNIPFIESQSAEQIKLFQEKKLADALSYLKKNSPFYQRLFKASHINTDEIKLIEDLSKIPVTTKDDLEKYNDAFICVPKNKIIDYITTSGTLGNPVTFALTDHDLDRLAYNESVSLKCANGSENEIYQLMTTLDKRFMAGLAYFLGARKSGAGIVRTGNGIPELQWDSVFRIQPTAFITVPSFLLKLAEYAEANHIDYKNCSVKKAICIGEAIRNPDFTLNTLGKRIKEKWNIELYSTYASTEMGAAFTECKEGKGGHHHPELIIIELLDENDHPVKEGEAGELTITTLGVEAMPLLRFKTGDVCTMNHEVCSCGRTTVRLSPIIGRKKQMIKLKGTTIYPPALYDVLNNMDEIENYVVEVFTNDLGTDEILIKIGCDAPTEHLEKEIKDHFRAKLRVAPAIEFKSVNEVNQLQFPSSSNRKPVNFIDRRKN
ncbi:MAG TPA: AMP-binding protein [Bacteroidia bacterium]|nr:AMP-binding protein [Bacteroidia bacterium]